MTSTTSDLDLRYAAFRAKYGFGDSSAVPSSVVPALGLQRAVAMSREAQVGSPVQFVSHRRFGFLLVFCKRLLARIMAPILRVSLVRQQNFNDLTVSLAFHVLELENRLAQLEKSANNKNKD